MANFGESYRGNLFLGSIGKLLSSNPEVPYHKYFVAWHSQLNKLIGSEGFGFWSFGLAVLGFENPKLSYWQIMP